PLRARLNLLIVPIRDFVVLEVRLQVYDQPLLPLAVTVAVADENLVALRGRSRAGRRGPGLGRKPRAVARADLQCLVRVSLLTVRTAFHRSAARSLVKSSARSVRPT